MISVCVCCWGIHYDDFDELVDFLDDNDVEIDSFVCDDCFFDFYGEPFCFDLQGRRVLFYTDEDLEEFLVNLRDELA